MAAVKAVARYRWTILGVAFMSQMSNALIAQSVSPLAPLFQPELNLSKAEVGFFASAAYAGAWGVLLAAGALTDRLGVRKVMSVGQLLAGSLMLSMSAVGAFLQALAVMFATGLGRGLTAPGLTKAVMDWFPPKERATAMGIKQAGVPLAGILTASTLPSIALIVGWRSAIGMVGFVIMTSGVLTAILYRNALSQMREGERRSSTREGLSEVLRNRRLWLLGIVAVSYVTVQTALIAHLALYLSEEFLVPVLDDERTRIVAAGGYLALAQAGGVSGRILWGVVSDRLFGGRRMVVLAIIGVITTASSLSMAFIGSGQPLWLLTCLVFVFGATAIGWNGLYQALIVETAGRKYAGTGVGLSMTLTQTGTVGGPPLFGFVVDLAGGYQPAWLFLASLAIIGSIVAVLTSGGERHLD